MDLTGLVVAKRKDGDGTRYRKCLDRGAAVVARYPLSRYDFCEHSLEPMLSTLLMNNEVKMSEDFKDGILREQIRLVMEQVPTMQVVSFIVALVLVYVVRDIVAPANILVWVLMVLLIVCSRIVLYFRFRKVREEPFAGEYWKNL
ncbi:MAG: hypothetical protein ABSH41_07845, partial [Syntrophobacteraceae bacterium]